MFLICVAVVNAVVTVVAVASTTTAAVVCIVTISVGGGGDGSNIIGEDRFRGNPERTIAEEFH